MVHNYLCHFDESGFLLSFEAKDGQQGQDIYTFDGSLLESDFINAYHIVEGQLVLDEDKKTEILEARNIQKRIEELKGKLQETDYIYNSIREGGRPEEYYAEVIENRKAWRKEIQELEEELGL